MAIGMDDAQGNEIWFIGSLNDANDLPLQPGQIFFSGYASTGVCAGQSFIDKPFQKKHTLSRGHHKPNHKMAFPKRWADFEYKFREKTREVN